MDYKEASEQIEKNLNPDGIAKISIGFLFSDDNKFVSLMKRKFPEFNDKILLTGIGGHVEEGETFLDAMAREFEEEAGLKIDNWKQFAVSKKSNVEVVFFKAFSNQIYSISSKETDMARFYNVASLNLYSTYPNVQYLVPAALDESLVSLNMRF